MKLNIKTIKYKWIFNKTMKKNVPLVSADILFDSIIDTINTQTLSNAMYIDSENLNFEVQIEKEKVHIQCLHFVFKFKLLNS